MRMFFFFTVQKHNDGRRRNVEMDIEAFTIKIAYEIWNARMRQQENRGWHVISNFVPT